MSQGYVRQGEGTPFFTSSSDSVVPHWQNDFTRYARRSVANYYIADSCRGVKIAANNLKAAKEKGRCHHSRD